jgi:RHS repeat-associated protein
VQDHLGSTNALTDATGTVISSASYDSFGNASGNLATRYGYTGREKDADTGLTYYRARWYSSELGRFINEDPIGLAGGINQFSYVKNNSVNATDSLGLDADSDQRLWQAQQDLIDFFADPIEFGMGFGDTALLGVPRLIRQWQGIDDPNLDCSWVYQAGGWTAFAIDIATGVTGLLKAGSKFALRKVAKEGVEELSDDGVKALSKVPDFANKRLAAEHYAKHTKGVIDKGGKQTVSKFEIDMPEFKSFKEYTQAARRFHRGSPQKGVLEGVRANGDFIRFQPSTGYFGVRTSNGVIRTFFRPSNGIDYFRSQF